MLGRRMERSNCPAGVSKRPAWWRFALQPRPVSAHGARILMEPTEFEYGERQYSAEDHAGHQWTLSETLADIRPEERGGITVRPD